MSRLVSTGDPLRIVNLLNVGTHALGGIVVLVWADTIVAWFEANDTAVKLEISGREVQSLAFAIVGLFILVNGVESAAAAGHLLWSKPGQMATGSYLWARGGQDVIRALVQTTAGILLIAGREALVRGWSQLRRAGAVDSAEPDDVP